MISSQRDLQDFLQWNSRQAHILTGNGRLDTCFPSTRFREQDLPHYYLANNQTREVFRRWIANEDQVANHGLIAGAWRRTTFRGGKLESNENDTLVYNIQANHIFIDMRFPVYRPWSWEEVSSWTCLEDLNADQLRWLARQHCFAGYSKIEYPTNTSEFEESTTNIHNPLDRRHSPQEFVLARCTRHHCIDWNYHPLFPRSRPNQWYIEYESDDRQAFIEYSVAQDPDYHNQPVYMERWQRYPLDSKGAKVLVIRLDPRNEKINDAILCTVGNHFAYSEDRRTQLAYLPESTCGATSGGCANLVDAAYQANRLDVMRALLSVEGSYGRVYHPEDKFGRPSWIIERSTQPWRQGRALFKKGEIEMVLNAETKSLRLRWKGCTWEVLENTYSIQELYTMLGGLDQDPKSKL